MEDLLLDACKTGDLPAVVAAVAQGADVHCYGDAPLMHAALRGHTFIVRHLWLHATCPRDFHVGQGTLRKVAERGYTDLATLLAPYATPSERAVAIANAYNFGQTDTAHALERVSPSKNDHAVCVSHGAKDERAG